MTDTLYTNAVQLLQKSRKALRLYKSLSYTKGDRLGELKEIQAEEWRQLNAGLLEQLSEVLSSPRKNELAAKLNSLKDLYHSQWRNVEAETNRLHRELISASERGDFIKSASLSSQLVGYKAKMQASQAAYHELDELVSDRITAVEEVVEEKQVVEQTRLAKIIPLRGKIAS